MKVARFAIVASALLFVAMATTASAAVRAVDISGFAFVPQSVTITVGDTVTWTNKDAAAHSARVNGVGTTAVLTQGQSGSLPFMNTGTFPYDCGIHGSSMTGTVIVRAAATPPPTQPPTLAPTPVPTSRQTVAPTIVATVPATPTASPSPAVTASSPTTAAPSETTSPTIAAAAPTEQPPAQSARGGVQDLMVIAGFLVLCAIAGRILARRLS